MQKQPRRLVYALMTASAILIQAPMALAAENCTAPINPTLKGAALSQQLRRYNSVLKPSKAADPDIIIPAPVIDDPLAIHPKDVPKNNPGKSIGNRSLTK